MQTRFASTLLVLFYNRKESLDGSCANFVQGDIQRLDVRACDIIAILCLLEGKSSFIVELNQQFTRLGRARRVDNLCCRGVILLSNKDILIVRKTTDKKRGCQYRQSYFSDRQSHKKL